MNRKRIGESSLLHRLVLHIVSQPKLQLPRALAKALLRLYIKKNAVTKHTHTRVEGG